MRSLVPLAACTTVPHRFKERDMHGIFRQTQGYWRIGATDTALRSKMNALRSIATAVMTGGPA
jgi:hypothetical protein